MTTITRSDPAEMLSAVGAVLDECGHLDIHPTSITTTYSFTDGRYDVSFQVWTRAEFDAAKEVFAPDADLYRYGYGADTEADWTQLSVDALWPGVKVRVYIGRSRYEAQS